MSTAIHYKISAERTQIVFRSHDFRFLYKLGELLEGYPSDSVTVDELKVFARDLLDVLDGEVASHAKDL